MYAAHIVSNSTPFPATFSGFPPAPHRERDAQKTILRFEPNNPLKTKDRHFEHKPK